MRDLSGKELCINCDGKRGEALLFGGYRLWLCRECFFELSHEKLIELREKADENQADMAYS